jgi:uncharacterized repeat protein (TIGR02543 family)
VTDPRVEPTETETGLTEGSHCSACNKVLVAQSVIPAKPKGISLVSASLKGEGTALTATVPYATEVFSFFEDITVSAGATYVVARDVYCEQVIYSKIAPLAPGDNVFYILVTNGNDMKLYTVTIRRRPMYTVSFATGGTAIEPQSVEEGALATAPTPTRAGYDFAGWDYDLDTPIMGDITVTAQWQARTDTAYKVEYYLEDLDGNGYTLQAGATEALTGTTGTTAEAEIKTFPHFTYHKAASTTEGVIAGDGSLVLKVYYTRNSYTVSTGAGDHGSVTGGGAYRYGSTVKLTAIPAPGYEFLGWYHGDTLLSSAPTYTFTVDADLSITAASSLMKPPLLLSPTPWMPPPV